MQIDDVATRAGVGVGTVYRHFPTKEALVTELVRERFAEFTRIARDAEAVEDPFAALAGVVERSCLAVAGDAGFQRAMMGSAELEWEGIEEEKASFFGPLAEIIRRGQQAGVVRRDLRVDDFAMLFCGITSTMYYMPAEVDWKRHMRIVLDGLRAR